MAGNPWAAVKAEYRPFPHEEPRSRRPQPPFEDYGDYDCDIRAPPRVGLPVGLWGPYTNRAENYQKQRSVVMEVMLHHILENKDKNSQLWDAFYVEGHVQLFGSFRNTRTSSEENRAEENGEQELGAVGGEPAPAVPDEQEGAVGGERQEPTEGERQEPTEEEEEKIAPSPPKQKKLCKFCRKNGSPKQYYESHNICSSAGKVTCPVLRQFDCPLCHASGDDAHTLKYCPLYTKVPHAQVMQARWAIHQRNRQNAARRAGRAGGARAVQGRQ